MDDPEIKKILKEIHELDENFIPLRNQRAVLRESLISALKKKNLVFAKYRDLEVKTINRTEKFTPEDTKKLKNYLSEDEFDYIFEPNLTKLKKIRNNLNVNAKNFINSILKTKIGFIIRYTQLKNDQFLNDTNSKSKQETDSNISEKSIDGKPKISNEYEYERVISDLKDFYSTNIEESQRQSGLIDYSEKIRKEKSNFKDQLRVLCIALKNLGLEDEDIYNPQICDDDTEFLRFHYSDFLVSNYSINNRKLEQPRPLTGDWREDPTSKI